MLPLEEAVAFLQSRGGYSDPAAAKALAEALGRLPLALDHAAAYCKRTQMQFGDYAKKISSLIDTAPRGAGYPRSVAATFDLAITEAVMQCPAAETLMAYLAQCAPERIPMMLVEGALDDEANLMAAIGTLAEVSLVKHDPFKDGTPAVIVHRLVRAVARVRANAHATAQYAVARLVARLATTYPADGYENIGPEYGPWGALSVLQKASRPTRPKLAVLVRLLLRRIEKLSEKTTPGPKIAASWSQCVQLTPHSLAISETEMPNAATRIDCASLLNQAGGYLYRRGDYSGARQLLERAVAIRDKVLGPEHPDTAMSRNNLALLDKAVYANVLMSLTGLQHDTLKEKGEDVKGEDVAEVREGYENALASAEQDVGPEHVQTATCLFRLATLLQDQGDLAAARPLFERALAIYAKLFGSDDPDTNRASRHLALLLLADGNAAEAHRLGETALAVHKKALGENHSWTKDSASVTAHALDALVHTEEAKALRERHGLAAVQNQNAS